MSDEPRRVSWMGPQSLLVLWVMRQQEVGLTCIELAEHLEHYLDVAGYSERWTSQQVSRIIGIERGYSPRGLLMRSLVEQADTKKVPMPRGSWGMRQQEERETFRITPKGTEVVDQMMPYWKMLAEGKTPPPTD